MKTREHTRWQNIKRAICDQFRVSRMFEVSVLQVQSALKNAVPDIRNEELVEAMLSVEGEGDVRILDTGTVVASGLLEMGIKSAIEHDKKREDLLAQLSGK